MRVYAILPPIYYWSILSSDGSQPNNLIVVSKPDHFAPHRAAKNTAS